LDTDKLSHMKVLIVDDQSDNLKVLYNTLRTAGYEISLAKTGQQALDHIRQHQPDLVLLDIILPDFSGFDICQQIKADDNTRHIPVIFISARLDSKDVIKGFDVGGVDYIRKPFVETEVLARVKNHLMLKTLQEDLEQQVEKRTAALSKAKGLAEAASQEKSRFLSRMSHELRTPLNAILGFAQLQKKHINSESKVLTTSQQYILEAGYHLLSLVDDMLDISSIENNKLKLTLQDIAIDQIIEAAIHLVKEQANQAGISIDYQRSSLSIVADKTRFQQIIMNLLVNAIKYNREQGSINVEVNIIEGGQVQVNIKDTGVGISNEDRDKLFNPFTRLDYAEEHEIQGVGTGLSLSKYLVEAMDGSIGFDSQLGVGSVFYVRLPLGKSVKQEVNLAVQTTQVDNESALTVMYIEDNAPSRILMEDITDGYANITLLTSNTAEQGIDAAKNQHPALIFIDINLPKMSGLSAVKILKTMFDHKVEIIALSADAMPTQINIAMEAGFDDYITKPIDIKEIRAIFNRLTKSID
jgi:signal transduction histidine kinase